MVGAAASACPQPPWAASLLKARDGVMPAACTKGENAGCGGFRLWQESTLCRARGRPGAVRGGAVRLHAEPARLAWRGLRRARRRSDVFQNPLRLPQPAHAVGESGG